MTTKSFSPTAHIPGSDVSGCEDNTLADAPIKKISTACPCNVEGPGAAESQTAPVTCPLTTASASGNEDRREKRKGEGAPVEDVLMAMFNKIQYTIYRAVTRRQKKKEVAAAAAARTEAADDATANSHKPEGSVLGKIHDTIVYGYRSSWKRNSTATGSSQLQPLQQQQRHLFRPLNSQDKKHYKRIDRQQKRQEKMDRKKDRLVRRAERRREKANRRKERAIGRKEKAREHPQMNFEAAEGGTGVAAASLSPADTNANNATKA